MYLKRIELQGFKSFAHRTKFEFHNGITCIVGPNGSGKSNVADAVRWVLGEQSAKQLRGGSMQDVIFAGTVNRRPLSSAFVAITLDNSDHALPTDFSEVTVARRLYRSGESEYLINGSPCRLKDVQELFYDTGVGKEGYSIIGQGQIEKIVSGRPEDRRDLFDEAAGIVKYKRRMGEAQKKLEGQNENLLRIGDIITELEKQKTPLEEQAKTAREYLSKKQELKDLDISYYLKVAGEIKKDLEEADKNISLVEEEKKEADQSYEKLKKDSSAAEKRLEALEGIISRHSKEKSDASYKKSEDMHKIELLTEQINAANVTGDHYKKSLFELEEKIDEIDKALKDYDGKLKGQDDSLRKAIETKDEKNDEFSKVSERIAVINEKIESGKERILELIEKKAMIKSEGQHFKTLVEQISIQKDEAKQKNEELLEERKQIGDLIKNTKDEKIRAEKELDQIKEQREEAKDRLNELGMRRNETQDRLETVSRTLIRSKSQLESLQNIAERYEGYGHATRKVMEKKKDYPKICGIVSELIHVDQKYETAIETALEGGIKNIVTEDEDTAKRMIDFLKKGRHGKVTFLPLTAVKRRNAEKEKQVLGEDGVIGLAPELVSYDEKYSDVVSQLLGQIIIVDNIDNALRTAKKNHYSLRLVTLAGEYLKPGGSITGGAFKNDANLLGRNRQMDELSQKIKDLEKNKNDLEKELSRIKDRRVQARNLGDELNEKIKEKEIEINSIKNSIKHREKDMEKKDDEIKDLKETATGYDKRQKRIEKESRDNELKEKESEKKSNEIAQENARLVVELSTLSERSKTLDEELKKALLDEAEEKRKMDYLSENIARIQGQKNEYLSQKKELSVRMDDQRDDADRKKENIKSLEKEIGLLDEKEEQASIKSKEALEEKEEVNKRYKEYFNTREDLTRKIGALEKESLRLIQKKEKYEERLKAQDSYMWNEYELTYHNAKDEAKDIDFSTEELSAKIKALKNDIKQLGPVNVNAIESFNEVSKRHEFLSSQKDDIEKARENLIKVIDDLDKGMREKFNENFALIREEFQKVFSLLFGGGKGTLELVDGEDELEAGIQINAQPPGKKLQNMMQLSGGEKSLTAICLLFAIQNLKPSPFCLLDEIEAALDEPNVERFAKYLHKLSKNTQFIVITHRRGSMNAADRLYGITMQEKGISAQVSVNLIEDDLEKKSA